MVDFGGSDVVLAVGNGVGSGPLLGVLLATIAPFAGLYAFAKLSSVYRSFATETVGPHVVEPVQREYGETPYTRYRYKYCGTEFERKTFLVDEDCEEFGASERT
ncbi:hypothetical protein BRC82_10490 [Halobacteriales archaeon QS_1_67_19]|nr:MAG: hypothetical protein BRC82_10490 [Halobacteriales archaeon QS_1_67_19]